MEATKKYELTDKTVEHEGRALRRIKALVDFEDVKAGELGGFVEDESNLSHEGKCWVGGNARVYGYAMVSGNSRVWGNARIHGHARVGGNSRVWGNARIHGHAMVSGDSRVYGDAEIHGDARVYGYARVGGNSKVYELHHILVVGTIGSRNDFTTFCRSKNGINVACGCFNGSIDNFLAKVTKTYKNNKHAKIYNLAAKLAEAQIERCE